MNLTPPFVAQERPNTCALACLRMILAFQGNPISEEQLIQEVNLQEGGLDPQEVSQLARMHKIIASEHQLTQEELSLLVSQNRFPIVFLNRRYIDGQDMGHAVIPIRFSRYYVTILDPLRGKRRVSKRKLEAGRRLVGRWVVIWNPSLE